MIEIASHIGYAERRRDIAVYIVEVDLVNITECIDFILASQPLQQVKFLHRVLMQDRIPRRIYLLIFDMVMQVFAQLASKVGHRYLAFLKKIKDIVLLRVADYLAE